MKSRWSWRSQARSLGLALGLVVLMRSFIAEAFFIPSESMQPTLEVGDRVVVTKFAYGLRMPVLGWRLVEGPAPRRGDVVVFVHPQTGDDLIKRVVALEGDTVELRGGRVIVNGAALPQRPVQSVCRLKLEGESEVPCRGVEEEQGGKRYTIWQRTDLPGADLPPLKVPRQSVFVLGDNRDNSNDSRYWGAVPLRNLKGRAERVLWSWTWRGGVHRGRWFKTIP